MRLYSVLKNSYIYTIYSKGKIREERYGIVECMEGLSFFVTCVLGLFGVGFVYLRFDEKDKLSLYLSRNNEQQSCLM